METSDNEAAVTEKPETNIAQDKLGSTSDNHHHDVDNAHSKPSHDSSKNNVIVIKRVKKIVHKHHGGAWKIAYADFVTAMMTFFLLMWLLSMLNKYQLQGIAEYFKDPTTKVTTKNNSNKNRDKINDADLTLKQGNEQQGNKKSGSDKSKETLSSEKMKQHLENELNKNPQMSQYKNALNFVVLSQGLKIELKDLENHAMFSTGKTDFADYAKDIIDWLSNMMNEYPNRVMIIGHTDGVPFSGEENYGNWELSADRANATRRELIKHGMDENKIVRVVGMADKDKLETATDNLDPKNRRIAIIVLTDEAYKKMMDE